MSAFYRGGTSATNHERSVRMTMGAATDWRDDHSATTLPHDVHFKQQSWSNDLLPGSRIAKHEIGAV